MTPARCARRSPTSSREMRLAADRQARPAIGCARRVPCAGPLGGPSFSPTDSRNCRMQQHRQLHQRRVARGRQLQPEPQPVQPGRHDRASTRRATRPGRRRGGRGRLQPSRPGPPAASRRAPMRSTRSATRSWRARKSSARCWRARRARPAPKASARPRAPATSSSSSPASACACRARSCPRCARASAWRSRASPSASSA